MKKLLFTLSLILPLAMMNNAEAQKADHVKKDVAVHVSDSADKTVKGTKKKVHDAQEKHNKHDKKMKNKHKKMMFNQDEINKDYEKAVKKIEKSQFNAEQKKILTQQAQENRDLAVKQLQERSELMKNHHQALMQDDSFKSAIKADKSNKKALKEVNELLED